MSLRTIIALIVFLYITHLSKSSNILVVFSVPEKRNSVLGRSLVNSLLKAGHEVTYVTPFSMDSKLSLEIVDISADLDDNIEELQNENEVGNSSSLQMELIGVTLAERALQHPKMQELLLNTTRHFDLVIAEWFYTGLMAPLASLFECPLIWYSSTEVSWKSINLVHSQIKGLDETTPGLSVTERIHQMWSRLYFTARNYYHFSSREVPSYEKNFRDACEVRWRLLPNYETLVYNSSMLLINSHPLLGPRTALPLNAKYIGGHHTLDVNDSLPTNLKKVLDESKDGVIYIDLESNIINNKLQERIAQELIEACSHIGQTVIWKYDEILVNLPRNLYTMKRPPQQAILKHPNTVGFINHGDMMSIIDATHYGIPILAVPVLEEQFVNTKLLVDRECGVMIDVNNELSVRIVEAVTEIVTNNSYRINAKTAKSIFRHRLTTPTEEFLHWVQMSISTRGARHLRSKTLQLSALETYNLDIALLLLTSLWFFTKLMKICRVHLTTDDVDIDDKKDL